MWHGVTLQHDCGPTVFELYNYSGTKDSATYLYTLYSLPTDFTSLNMSWLNRLERVDMSVFVDNGRRVWMFVNEVKRAKWICWGKLFNGCLEDTPPKVRVGLNKVWWPSPVMVNIAYCVFLCPSMFMEWALFWLTAPVYRSCARVHCCMWLCQPD